MGGQECEHSRAVAHLSEVTALPLSASHILVIPSAVIPSAVIPSNRSLSVKLPRDRRKSVNVGADIKRRTLESWFERREWDRRYVLWRANGR